MADRRRHLAFWDALFLFAFSAGWMWDRGYITAIPLGAPIIPITERGYRSCRASDFRLLAFCASSIGDAGYFRGMFRSRRIFVLRVRSGTHYRAPGRQGRQQPILVYQMEIGSRDRRWSGSGVEAVGMVRRAWRVFACCRLGNPFKT